MCLTSAGDYDTVLATEEAKDNFKKDFKALVASALQMKSDSDLITIDEIRKGSIQVDYSVTMDSNKFNDSGVFAERIDSLNTNAVSLSLLMPDSFAKSYNVSNPQSVSLSRADWAVFNAASTLSSMPAALIAGVVAVLLTLHWVMMWVFLRIRIRTKQQVLVQEHGPKLGHHVWDHTCMMMQMWW